MNSIKKAFLVAGTLVLLITLSLQAQQPITIVEKQIKFSHGEYPGLSMEIPEVSYDEVTKELTKRIEKGTKSKVQVHKGEYSIFGAQMDAISLDPINLYTSIHSADSSVTIDIIYEIKPKEYLSNSTFVVEYEKAKANLFEFGKDLYSDHAKGLLKDEQKTLQKLEQELESLRSNKEKLEKSILSENSSINECNNQILLLNQEAQSYNAMIAKERSGLLNMEESEAKSAKEDEIKDLEKKKKKAQNASENNQKKVLSSQTNIDHANLDIQTNTHEQSTKMADIEKQKAITLAAEQKYNTILEY